MFYLTMNGLRNIHVKSIILGFIFGTLFILISNDITNLNISKISFIEKHLLKNKKIPETSEISETSIADKLAKEVRILCWVMTYPPNFEKKIPAVKSTWGKRCNKLYFMSTEANESLGIIDLNVTEGRNYLWGKTKAAFKYIYDNDQEEYDWVLKADDDTYVIIENLRYMLSYYNKNTPIYFGCKFKKYVNQGYMSGGGGYVLSREAVKKFVEEAIPDPTKCKFQPTGAEDVEVGKCLQKVGVFAGDSRDNSGKGRFFPFNPVNHLIDNKHVPLWYWEYVYYPTENNRNCCSSTAISFHYITPDKMYELEYLIYVLSPYGIFHKEPFPPLPPPDKNGLNNSWVNRK